MAFWNKKESRSIEDPANPITYQDIVKIYGADSLSSAGVSVTVDKALGVPAVMAAVQFLSGTIAGLPLNTFKKTDSGREKLSDGLQTVLHSAVSDEMTSFAWRKQMMEAVLTRGRSLTYIERKNGKVINLFPLDLSCTTIKRSNFKTTYTYKSANGAERVYKSSDVIDISFALESNGLQHISPLLNSKDAIGLMIAATSYGAKFFNNGGVPPFVVTGKFESGQALKRASNDLSKAIKEASIEKNLALTLPLNHEIKPIGADPEKSQLVELKRFQIEEIARIYSLPPVFLQDLTHGTYSNTEQQDLHLVKHTLRRWIVQIEQELNLKLFGRENVGSKYAEFNVDGLLRGDFSSRMQGYATAVQNAILTPNEIRASENRADKDNADDLLIQGATVPLGTQNVNEEVQENV